VDGAPKAILWIMPEPPQNPGIGGALRMYWIVRGVRQALPGTRHFGVAAVDVRFDEGARRAEALFDELHRVEKGEETGAEAFAAAFFQKLSPPELASAASWWLQSLGPLRRKAREVLAAHPEIDVVHLDHLNLAPLAPWLRRYTRAPIALTAHNTYSLLAGATGRDDASLAQWLRWAAGLAARAAHGTPWIRYDRPRALLAQAVLRLSGRVDPLRHVPAIASAMDAWYGAKADLLLCTSEQEAALLSQTGRRTVVAPNGASAEDLSPVFQARRAANPRPVGAPVFGFVGAASYLPYQAACELLLQSFAKAPDLGRLRLIGYDMGQHVPRLATYAACRNVADVTVVDSPRELRPHLVDLDAMVLPIFSGGGTRLKVVEAVFAGIPLVASRKAVEGLELDPERDCSPILEATPDAVAQAVRRFVKDRERYAERVVALREKWLARYDWLAIGAKVAEALATLGESRH